MKVFIEKVKGRNRVKFSNGNQTFTIDSFDDYNDIEIGIVRDTLIGFFEAYKQSIEQSNEQPEAIAGHQENDQSAIDHRRKEEYEYIMSMVYKAANHNDNSPWRPHSNGYYYHFVEGAEYVLENILPQQTASKDQKITKLTNLLSDTNKRIQEIQDEEELKDKQLQVQQSHIDDQDQLIFEQGKEIADLKENINRLIEAHMGAEKEVSELKAEVERLKGIGHTPESEMHELSTRELIERLIASQLKVEKLEFIIEHGLGHDDMINDITMPHEI